MALLRGHLEQRSCGITRRCNRPPSAAAHPADPLYRLCRTRWPSR